MKTARIILLSGEIQTGKTNLSREVAQHYKEAGFKVAGLVSPAVFEGGEKTAIEVLNLISGERQLLAVLRKNHHTYLETKRWSFFPKVVAWGNQVLQNAVPCELLIVDELGPVEFIHGEGWLNGFCAIDSYQYQAALVVIRPSLIPQALERWTGARVINLSDPQVEPGSVKAQLESLLLEP